MILNDDNQKNILLQIINGTTFKGDTIEVIADLKQQIVNAPLQSEMIQSQNAIPQESANPKLDTTTMGAPKAVA